VYGPPVEWSASGRRAEDVARLTQHVASVIEGWVRETPEQWLWLHRRWKTSPSRGAGAVVGAEGSLPVPSDPSEPGQKGVPQDD
jgi:hypothetical protein